MGKYKNDPAPLASAVRILDQYQQAVSSTFRPDIRVAIMALSELVGRARETIERLRKTGAGMFYFARVYSGEHDTSKVEGLLRERWPHIDWDIEAMPAIDTSAFTDPREKEKAELPLYRAFVGDAEIEELKQAILKGEDYSEIEIEKEGLVIGVF